MLPLQGTQGQFLVVELSSHKAPGIPRKKGMVKKKKRNSQEDLKLKQYFFL